jgi:TP901 family phage tail tape measure protein
VGKALDSLGIKSKTVSNALKRDFDKAADRVERLGKTVKNTMGFLVKYGSLAVGAGLGIVTKQFIDFDAAITAASAKFKDVNLSTPEGYQNYLKTLELTGAKAREVAAVTEYNAVDTAGALDKMAMAGLTSAQSMSLLMGTTNLATAAGTDLTTAVDIATDALGAFGLMSTDTNVLSGNLNRLSDVMARTTNMFNTDMGMMFEAIKKGAPTFTAAGQSLEDFSAMVGVLAASGIKGEEAGTQLRNVIASLAAPSSTAQKALERLGISVSDARGNFRNILDIVGQFEVAFGEDIAREFKRQAAALESIEGVSAEEQIEALYDQFSAGMTGSTQKIADLNEIFGKRTVTSMLLMLAEGTDSLRNFSTELVNAGGTAKNVADAMRGSIKNQIAGLGSAATEMGFKFVSAFKDKATAAIVNATMAIRNFDVTPLVEMASAAADGIMKFAGVLMGAVKITWQFRGIIATILIPIAAVNLAFMIGYGAIGLYNKIMLIKNGVVAIATGIHMAYASVIQGNTAGTAALAFTTDGARVSYVLFSGVLKGAKLIGEGFTKVLDMIRNKTLLAAIAQGIQAAVTGAATVAQWAFNTAATANPIGLIIVGAIIAIAAIIAIIVVLKKNWDKVTEAVKEHADKILAVLTIIIWPLGLIISVIKEVVSNWGRIKEALAATGLFDKLKDIGEGIKNFFGSIGEKISSIFSGIGAAIKNFIKPAIDWLTNVWTSVKNAVGGFFSYVINGIKSFFEPAIIWVVNAWHTATSAIGGFFKGIFDAVYNFVKPALDWFAETWQQIVSFFTDNAIGNAIKVIGGTLLSGLLVPVQGLLEILSYIPGLGHLAGKGADKIQEFRNFLKGTDDAAKTKQNKKIEELTPESEADKVKDDLNASGAFSLYDILGFGIPGIPGMDGADGKSKLHGVVDISGGVIPGIDGGGTYTTTGAVNGAMPPTGETLITRTAAEIAVILRRIDAGVSFISHSLPVSVRSELPAISAPVTATSAPPSAEETLITRTAVEIAAALRHIDTLVSLIANGLPITLHTPAPVIAAPQVNVAPAVIPPFPGDEAASVRAAAVNTPAIPAAITQNITGMAATLRHIDASVSLIANGLPIIARAPLPEITRPAMVTQTNLALPRVSMSDDEEDASDYYNPRAIAPITQAERMAYSFSEHRETIVIEVAAEKGTTARIVRAPRDVDIQLVTSGGNR